MHRSRIETVGLALLVLAMVALTLAPDMDHGPRSIDLCLVCGTIGSATTVLNVVLFAPLGFLLRRRLASSWRVVGAGFLFSFGIEVVQYFIPGRESALSDVVANTAGAALGAYACVRWSALAFPSRAASRMAALSGAVLFTGSIVATGPLLDPAAPVGDYYAQWTPSGWEHRIYAGEVISASLAGEPLSSKRLEHPETVRARILDGGELRVRFRTSPPPDELEPVLRLVAGPYGEGIEVLTVEVEGTALVISMRRGADYFQLSRSSVVLPRAFEAVGPGDTVDVRVRRVIGEGFSVAVGDAAPTVSGFSAGRGWTLLYYPGTMPASWMALLDHLWFLGLALILGWFALDAATKGACLVLVAGALLLIPAATDLTTTPWTLFAMVALGLAAGGATRCRLTPTQR